MVAVAASVYSYLRRGPKLAESDAVLLTDFSNKTGEAAFDGSLRAALGVSLAQSPYVNVVSDEKVSEALRGLGRSADEPLTRDLAQKICERAGAKAVVAGGIARDRATYAVSLYAFLCVTVPALPATRA